MLPSTTTIPSSWPAGWPAKKDCWWGSPPAPPSPDPAGPPALSDADQKTLGAGNRAFAFDMYGTSNNVAQVASNGFLRLGTGTATAYANTTMPNSAALMPSDVRVLIPSITKPMCATDENAMSRFMSVWAKHPSAP